MEPMTKFDRIDSVMAHLFSIVNAVAEDSSHSSYAAICGHVSDAVKTLDELRWEGLECEQD